jgi:hypothetical protein
VVSCGGGSHRWSREAREVARVQKRLTTAGVVVRGSTAEAFGGYMARIRALERGARGGGHSAAVAAFSNKACTRRTLRQLGK